MFKPKQPPDGVDVPADCPPETCGDPAFTTVHCTPDCRKIEYLWAKVPCETAVELIGHILPDGTFATGPFTGAPLDDCTGCAGRVDVDLWCVCDENGNLVQDDPVKVVCDLSDPSNPVTTILNLDGSPYDGPPFDTLCVCPQGIDPDAFVGFEKLCERLPEPGGGVAWFHRWYTATPGVFSDYTLDGAPYVVSDEGQVGCDCAPTKDCPSVAVPCPLECEPVSGPPSEVCAVQPPDTWTDQPSMAALAAGGTWANVSLPGVGDDAYEAWQFGIPGECFDEAPDCAAAGCLYLDLTVTTDGPAGTTGVLVIDPDSGAVRQWNNDGPGTHTDTIELCCPPEEIARWQIIFVQARRHAGTPVGAVWEAGWALEADLAECDDVPDEVPVVGLCETDLARLEPPRYTECVPYMASFTGDPAPPVEPYRSLLITKPDCCVVTVTTDAGTVVLPRSPLSWTANFDCDLTVLELSGDCLAEVTAIVTHPGRSLENPQPLKPAL